MEAYSGMLWRRRDDASGPLDALHEERRVLFAALRHFEVILGELERPREIVVDDGDLARVAKDYP